MATSFYAKPDYSGLTDQEVADIEAYLSGYQIWLRLGNTGTEEEFLASLNGADGDTGPAGPQGAEGPEGPIGPEGPQGDAGPQGDQGIQGVAGPEGPQGIQGADGATGPAGPEGPQGPQGIQGVKGDTGDTGPQGPAGPEGPTGSDGADGADGPQGPAGADGVGIPTGGSTNQVLAKASSTDFDTAWVNAPTGGGGSGAAPSASFMKRTHSTTFDLTGNYVGDLLPFDTSLEDYSTGDITFSGSTFTVTEAGHYNIGGVITLESGGLRAQASVKIYVNGVPRNNILRGSGYIRNSGDTSDYWALEIATEPTYLNANDTIEFYMGEAENQLYDFGDTPPPHRFYGPGSMVWVQRAEGAKGDAGEAGPEGPAGPQGDTGPQGPQGDTGPQGPQGPSFNGGEITSNVVIANSSASLRVQYTGSGDFNTAYNRVEGTNAGGAVQWSVGAGTTGGNWLLTNSMAGDTYYRVESTGQHRFQAGGVDKMLISSGEIWTDATITTTVSGEQMRIGRNSGHASPYIGFYSAGDTVRVGYIQSRDGDRLRLNNDNGAQIDLHGSISEVTGEIRLMGGGGQTNPTIKFADADTGFYGSGGNIYATVNGVQSAAFTTIGTSTPLSRGIITREKGDSRYQTSSSLSLKKNIVKSRPPKEFWEMEPFFFEYDWEGMEEGDPRRGYKTYGFALEEMQVKFPQAVKLEEFIDPVPLCAALYAETNAQRVVIKNLLKRVKALEEN